MNVFEKNQRVSERLLNEMNKDPRLQQQEAEQCLTPLCVSITTLGHQFTTFQSNQSTVFTGSEVPNNRVSYSVQQQQEEDLHPPPPPPPPRTSIQRPALLRSSSRRGPTANGKEDKPTTPPWKKWPFNTGENKTRRDMNPSSSSSSSSCSSILRLLLLLASLSRSSSERRIGEYLDDSPL
ncbi:unnamed protein product [Pleuronectes platessa]|uniref:Uncharacterized protein n=1 Tax=Pleuronectes platessa TaxID=8262 RepID=A0A9N7VJR7_PLEPL|nr:unnamed protein product [Pleuronectes platessa]